MLRALYEADLSEVMKVESVCQQAPWTNEVFQKCLQAGSIGWVVEVEGKIIGFILVLFQVDEAHILNFCIHPDHQHQGLGRQLLLYALEDLKQKRAKYIYLEVRRSNKNAIALYEKMGFHKVGERKDYYLSVGSCEDAMVFARHLE